MYKDIDTSLRFYHIITYQSYGHVLLKNKKLEKFLVDYIKNNVFYRINIILYSLAKKVQIYLLIKFNKNKNILRINNIFYSIFNLY